jgi:hypothetical protein
MHGEHYPSSALAQGVAELILRAANRDTTIMLS